MVKWQDETMEKKTRDSLSCPTQCLKNSTNSIIQTEHNSNSGTSICIFRKLGGSYYLSVVQMMKPTHRTAAGSHRVFGPKLLHTFPLACHLSSTLSRVSLRISRHRVLDLVTMLRMAVNGQE